MGNGNFTIVFTATFVSSIAVCFSSAVKAGR
jgi:hypothetical protein